jgi:DNA-binding NtrC family response regulator
MTGHILCIDADDDSRHLIAELLYEHEVDFALTAEDAVQLAHYRHYDLYFVDPAVPGYTGSELLRDLRLYDEHAPVIICGGRREADGDGNTVSARLRKPLCAALVRATAAGLLDDRIASRERNARAPRSAPAR